MAQTTTGLFRLPEKLRYRIYKEVLSSAVVCYPSRNVSRKCLVFDGEPQAPGILLASKQIFQETLRICHATSYFRFNDICCLLDWSRTVRCTQLSKRSSICLVREVQLFEEDLRENDGSNAGEDSSEATSRNIGERKGDQSSIHTSERSRSLFEELEGSAMESLQDDINLAAEYLPRLTNLFGKLYTLDSKGEARQLHATVMPHPIITKRATRRANDAQVEQKLFRWGPFDDPFLDTEPGEGGLWRRTKALAKLCNFIYIKEKSEDEDEVEGGIEPKTPCKSVPDDPFVDSPPRKSRTRERSDSAIEMCGFRGKSARSTITCDPPRWRDVSPIKRIYPDSLVWKNAAVPKFEPHPSGRIWA